MCACVLREVHSALSRERRIKREGACLTWAIAESRGKN